MNHEKLVTTVITGANDGTNDSHRIRGPFNLQYLCVTDPNKVGYSVRLCTNDSDPTLKTKGPVVFPYAAGSSAGILYVGPKQALFFHFNDDANTGHPIDKLTAVVTYEK